MHSEDSKKAKKQQLKKYGQLSIFVGVQNVPDNSQVSYFPRAGMLFLGDAVIL